jgi:hypothetical protein
MTIWKGAARMHPMRSTWFVDSKDGEMSEWLKEHAWKLIPLARADAHRILPTHSRSTTSRNNDLLQSAPVNDGVGAGFRGGDVTQF